MVCHWVIGLLVLSGFAYVSGDDCDTATANVCYDNLLHYESIAFPLYGEDKEFLEETCATINSSYDCLNHFISYCVEETAECDKECQSLKHLAKHFIKYSGLKNLYDALCSLESALSITYLENVECLYSIADSYASCHNDSQRSQHYLSTQPQSVEKRCCFFKWHEECFVNATSEPCGENATFFVSFATHELMGHIAQKICFGVESTCTRPPLPTGEDNDEENNGKEEKDNDKGEKDNDIDEKDNDVHHNTTESQTESELDNEIDTGNSAAIIRFYATNWIVLPFLYILLSKYVL